MPGVEIIGTKKLVDGACFRAFLHQNEPGKTNTMATDPVEPAFDTTLADLRTAITVDGYDPATRRITVSMDYHTMRDILTSASLHEYGTPVEIEPVDPDSPHADIVRENNHASLRDHWLRRDSIDFLTEMMNQTIYFAHGSTPSRDISSGRRFRKWPEDRTTTQIGADKTARREWLRDQNLRPLTEPELQQTVTRMLAAEPLDRMMILRLLTTALSATEAERNAKTRITKAIAFLQKDETAG